LINKRRFVSNSLPIHFICLGFFCGAFAGSGLAQSAPPELTSAWHEGRFQVDVPGVISRSDIVLGRPNLESGEGMPLGNGRLGVAVWSAEGLTAQLNRNDTLPDRLSPGQVVVPGLAALTRAKDYSGRLDLYRGEFHEQGGGMTAIAFVEPHTDTLVIDVTGANPSETQTAVLKLWAPRTPRATAEGRTGSLAESWIDNKNPGASGRAFGALSAITADGRDVSAVVTDSLTVTVSFKPHEDGHFRVIVAAPHFDGTGNANDIAAPAFSLEPDAAHRSWWQDFWTRAAPIKITSGDGAGEYMENLRNIYLFVAAIEKGVEYPGSQAGVGDMISAAEDEHHWDASAFWHWNLRMQVAANIGAGLPDLNAPYFNLYRENLANIERWTKENMKGLPGICVPETMRFNGPGIEYESYWKPIAMGRNCDADFKPYYNARTISTGAEVSLWVWQQYLATGDRKFLAENYPLMAASVRFLLAYQKLGPDGMLHTSPSNAHENHWDVTDPTTDLSAMQALYPATIEAAGLLGKDADLVEHLKAALPKVPPLPRTQQSGPRTLLPSSADAEGADVIAESYLPAAEIHNVENIGLEPVWPYALIGDTSPLFPLAQRTFAHRPNPAVIDWSSDPIQAARLGLGSDVGSTLIAITQRNQGFVNGMAKWEASSREFYVEQTGVVADALQEALVQDYDGLIRVAPAVPPGWDFDGSVYVRGNAKVDVQTRNGVVTTLVIEVGANQPIKIRNPWPGRPVDVISAKTGKPVVSGGAGPVIEFSATAGTVYGVENHGVAGTKARFTPVSGAPATAAKKLGPVQIGLFADDR
jgi:alpha-L-fucosidase 2